MVRTFLKQQYIELAGRFEAKGEILRSIACTLSAAHMGFPQNEAAEALKTTLTRAAIRAKPDPGCLEYLESRKQKLDEVAVSELQVRNWGASPVSCDLLARARPAAKPLDKGFCKQIQRVLRHLRRGHPGVAKSMATHLKRLDHQIAAAIDAIGPEKKARRRASSGNLSDEHELHNLGNQAYKIAHQEEGRREYFDVAIVLYDHALEIDATLLETYFNRSLAWTRKCDYRRALDDMDRVIGMNPRLAEAHYTKGLVLFYDRRFDEAVACFERALEEEPNYTKAKAEREVAMRRAKEEADHSCRAGQGRESSREDAVEDFACYLVKPSCRFAEVGGNREAKRHLQTVAAFLKGDRAQEDWGAELPRGVLLAGPPGVGKTLLAEALAGECGCDYFSIPSTVCLSMWYGNSAANVRNLWDQAAKRAPSIIYLDEIDALASRRSDLGSGRGDDCHNRTVAALLEAMDGMRSRRDRVVVIGTTNRPGNLDAAFLRPGRFSLVVHVIRPTAKELAEIWLIHLQCAERRARRSDVLSCELQSALYEDRLAWVGNAFASGGADPSGLVDLARASAEHGLTGDDVREVVRRTISDRAMASREWGADLGPISAVDLEAQLKSYLECRRRSEDEYV